MKPGQPLPARTSHNGRVRWCLCCDTPLPANGASPLCHPHRRLHRSLRRRWNASPRSFQFETRYLDEAHALLDEIERDLGRVVVADAAGRNPRGKRQLVDADVARFITTFRERFPRRPR